MPKVLQAMDDTAKKDQEKTAEIMKPKKNKLNLQLTKSFILYQLQKDFKALKITFEFMKKQSLFPISLTLVKVQSVGKLPILPLISYLYEKESSILQHIFLLLSKVRRKMPICLDS